MPISLTAYQRSVTDENGFRYTHTLRFYNAGDDDDVIVINVEQEEYAGEIKVYRS